MAVRFLNGTYFRHGLLRRLGHAGSPVGTGVATTGRIRLEGIFFEKAIQTFAVLPRAGLVWLKDHTGWAQFGAAIVMRTRDPARYSWTS